VYLCNIYTIIFGLQMEKWASRQSIGCPVWPTRFIPMKTPLSNTMLTTQFPDTPCPNPLTIASVLTYCQDHDYRLGLVINLAAHDCLYSEDLPSDILMEHIRLTAKILPPIEAVQRVIVIADDFWKRRPDEYVAIHCDYGVFSLLSGLCGVPCSPGLPRSAQHFCSLPR
jgi:hypothetical protein